MLDNNYVYSRYTLILHISILFILNKKMVLWVWVGENFYCTYVTIYVTFSVHNENTLSLQIKILVLWMWVGETLYCIFVTMYVIFSVYNENVSQKYINKNMIKTECYKDFLKV